MCASSFGMVNKLFPANLIAFFKKSRPAQGIFLPAS
jgi:hypothetical protein